MKLEQAIQFVLEPCSDSELSELESDDEYAEAEQSQLVVEDRIGEDKNVDIPEDNDLQSDIEEAEENETLHKNDDTVTGEKQNQIMSKVDSSLRQFRWCSCLPPDFDKNYHGRDFSLPPDDFDTLTPYQYFIKFWNDNLIETIAEHKNIYSFQKSGKIINHNVTKSEIEQFTGI